MNKEEVPQVPPPPPPPSPPLGFRLSHNHSSPKMDKEEEVPRAPPPPPPPRLLGFRRSHSQSCQKMDKKEVPPAPPPTRSTGFIGSHNQSYKKMHKGEVAQAFLSRKLRQFNNHDMSKMCPIERPLCPLSHPNHPHILLRGYSESTSRPGCFSCGRQKSFITELFYHCLTCDVEFHDGCHKFPRKITHPYHLQHPLTFTFQNYETRIISDGQIDESFCNAVLSDSGVSNKFGAVEVSQSQSDIVFYQCTWCAESIKGNWFYLCSICNFCLDLSCSRKVPALIIANPKSHHHSLVFYPRQLLTPCDACGLVNVLEPSYACFQCNYMVHQSCIDLPRVIKITRHQHRLFHTLYLQPLVPPCQICYQKIDTKYGQYSCNHEKCLYVVHSKCATHDNIWDKVELEWEPEEPDDTEDRSPFKKVGKDMIKHFSHEHLLKLEKYDSVRDAEKQCKACILPINAHDFYNCTECNFPLHEVCAGLLRKQDHALHVHPLVLDPFYSTRYYRCNDGCSVCSRKTSGFVYKCSRQSYATCGGLQICVCCMLVPAYFTHKAHQHPIFISSTSYNGKDETCCKGCKKICLESYLQCTICEFSMCYQCATIPNEVSYKYDKHPLSLCFGEEVDDGIYWCEVCEKEVNPTDWFYICNGCCITIHVQCIFGSSIYMLPGFKFFSYNSKVTHFALQVEVEIFRNSNSTRPICRTCGHRCPSSVYYSCWHNKMTFCSLTCFGPTVYSRPSRLEYRPFPLTHSLTPPLPYKSHTDDY